MAKLSTPYRECAVTYVDEHGVPVYQDGRRYHCPSAAYRKHDGKWLCRTHLQQAKARAARVAITFTAIGSAR
jgi:hypothetical protein